MFLVIAQRLPPALKAIDKDCRRKKEQLAVVNKHVSQLIVAKHPSYAAELVKVRELQSALLDALRVCQASRRYSAD
jgi:hypothetical protein